MAQRASPRAMRLGYNQNWNTYYFAKNKREEIELAKKVKAIRDYFYSRWRRNIAKLETELTDYHLKIKVYVADTVAILGENNQNSEKVLQGLYQTLQDNQIKVELELSKIKNPYTNTQLVSNMIAEQLEKRLFSRRVLNFFLNKVSGEPEVKGVRIEMDGRLDGSENTQEKKVTWKRMPLNYKSIWVEEGKERAIITKGVIGIKVLIYKGRAYPNYSRSKTLK
jgi:small subunit ribosomal protein S3